MLVRRFGMLMLVILALIPVQAQESELSFRLLGTYNTGIFDEGAQEIGAYDASSQRLFVTNAQANRIDILSLANPSMIELVSQISLDDYGAGINSVAVHKGLVVAAVQGAETGVLGMLVFLNSNGEVLKSVEAGYLPDMVTFSPDGQYVVSANEGEPNSDYSVDPEGSVTIVSLMNGLENATVLQVPFTDFNTGGTRAAELPADVRIFGLNASVAQDLEPEYVAISPDSSTAFVTLQENNAVAVIELATGTISRIMALGFKDHSLEVNSMDTSDKDDAITMRTAPVMGMYLPDAIATYEVAGMVYVVTANEGDSRDYDAFSEEARIGDEDILLDATAFPNAAELQAEDNLGRLKITNTLGDTDGDGDYDVLYSFGGRSFSIFSADGTLVYDSGNAFETYAANNLAAVFNSEGTLDGFDSRSDDKGVEPEGMTIATIGQATYAFITLERISGVIVYNISNPTAPTFVNYLSNTLIEGSAEDLTAGDIAPEATIFISAENSPTGQALLVVMNEVSGSTSVYEITVGGM